MDDLLGYVVVREEDDPKYADTRLVEADWDGIVHATRELANAALAKAQEDCPSEDWHLAEVRLAVD